MIEFVGANGKYWISNSSTRVPVVYPSTYACIYHKALLPTRTLYETSNRLRTKLRSEQFTTIKATSRKEIGRPVWSKKIISDSLGGQFARSLPTKKKPGNAKDSRVESIATKMTNSRTAYIYCTAEYGTTKRSDSVIEITFNRRSSSLLTCRPTTYVLSVENGLELVTFLKFRKNFRLLLSNLNFEITDNPYLRQYCRPDCMIG